MEDVVIVAGCRTPIGRFQGAYSNLPASDLAAKRVVAVRVQGLRLVRPITAAYHRDKRVSPAMQQLITLLRRHAHPPRAR